MKNQTMTYLMSAFTLFLLAPGAQAQPRPVSVPFVQAAQELNTLLGKGFIGKDAEGAACAVAVSYADDVIKVQVTQKGAAYTAPVYNWTSTNQSFIPSHYVWKFSTQARNLITVGYANYNDGNLFIDRSSDAQSLKVYFTRSLGKGPWNDFTVQCSK